MSVILFNALLLVHLALFSMIGCGAKKKDDGADSQEGKRINPKQKEPPSGAKKPVAKDGVIILANGLRRHTVSNKDDEESWSQGPSLKVSEDKTQKSALKSKSKPKTAESERLVTPQPESLRAQNTQETVKSIKSTQSSIPERKKERKERKEKNRKK